jgi:hypothetical protein
MVHHLLFHAGCRRGSVSARRIRMPPERASLPSKMIGHARSRRNIRVLARQIGARPLAFAGAISLSLGRRRRPGKLKRLERCGARDVDLALKLNVLAVFAVFAFVAAILLGAF